MDKPTFDLPHSGETIGVSSGIGGMTTLCKQFDVSTNRRHYCIVLLCIAPVRWKLIPDYIKTEKRGYKN